MKASWMPPNSWLSWPAIAPPLRSARLAFLEGLERDEHDARVRAVGEAVDRQARKGDRVFDAGLLQRDLAHAADHVFGAVQRGAVGQLREADQVLLVLRRHEAAGHRLEQAEGRRRPARGRRTIISALREITRLTPPL